MKTEREQKFLFPAWTLIDFDIESEIVRIRERLELNTEYIVECCVFRELSNRLSVAWRESGLNKSRANWWSNRAPGSRRWCEIYARATA